jgi:glycogen(starch) synthase
MKILVITLRYPPYHLGGYEIRCKNIIDELYRRGHEILVITSIKETTPRGPHQAVPYQIFRRLHVSLKVESFIARLTLRRWSYLFGILLVFARELLFDLLDIKLIDREIKRYKPDAIYLGHVTIFSKALMPFFSDCAIPIVYDEGGSGLIDSWEEKGIWYKLIEEYASRYSIVNAVKPLIVKIVCKVSANRMKPQWAWPAEMRIFFNSELNRRNSIASGVPVKDMRVIHSGVDIKKFDYRSRIKPGSPVVCIVPGRIEPRKGQMDAVRLLAKLREQGVDAKMLLVGEKWVNSYYLEIENEIKELRLEGCITLVPMVTQDKLVELYHQADICFFPSYQKEGYSRIPLEAMACGCVVISYGNEGSDEIIRDKHTGFIVPPADIQALTDIIKELFSKPDKVREIIETARNEIETNCSMEKYVDSIEQLVLGATGVY